MHETTHHNIALLHLLLFSYYGRKLYSDTGQNQAFYFIFIFIYGCNFVLSNNSWYIYSYIISSSDINNFNILFDRIDKNIAEEELGRLKDKKN